MEWPYRWAYNQSKATHKPENIRHPYILSTRCPNSSASGRHQIPPSLLSSLARPLSLQALVSSRSLPLNPPSHSHLTTSSSVSSLVSDTISSLV
jgi:hypothetical protein